MTTSKTTAHVSADERLRRERREASYALSSALAKSGVSRGIDWSQVADLGCLPDAWVARRLGVSQPAVTRARQRLGIDPAVPAGRPSREVIEALRVVHG